MGLGDRPGVQSMTAAALPSLRDELTLHPGPVAHDGAPTWTLHDPLRNQFYRLTWAAFEVRQWGVTGDASANGTLRVRASVINIADQPQPYPFCPRWRPGFCTTANAVSTTSGAVRLSAVVSAALGGAAPGTARRGGET